MKKSKIIVLLALSLIIIGCGTSKINSQNKSSTYENNQKDNTVQISEEYNFDNFMKNGYIIRKTTYSTEEKDEIYNKNRLDEFLMKVKDNKSDNITIVEYLNQNDILTINKLTEVRYDGKDISVIYYDVFTNKNDFKVSEKLNFSNIYVKEVENAFIYLFVNDKNEETKLISFDKSEIK